MAGDQDSHTKTLGECADEFPHLLNACRVQAVCGFIQKQQAGMSKQGGSQSKALFHAQRVLSHFFVLLFFHTDSL